MELIEKAATQVQNRIDRRNNLVIYGVPEQINKFSTLIDIT